MLEGSNWFFNWSLITPGPGFLFSAVCKYVHKFACLSSLPGCWCWKQSPGIGWRLMDIFSPFWPDSVSPPLGRDNLCLLSYHGGHSPPSLLPLSLSPRVSSVLFWMCPSPVVSSSATVTSCSGGGCAMGLWHGVPSHLCISPPCSLTCHSLSCCCSLNTNLPWQQ